MKIKVAVINGGYSGEAEVSHKSAQMIMNNIDRNRFEPTLISIDKSDWLAHIGSDSISMDRNDFSVPLADGSKLNFDVACIMIHGTPGEDGKLQGYLDMLQIPYTTGGVLNMATTFNKKYTTRLLENWGFKVAKSIVLHDPAQVDVSSISQTLKFPLFVKPNEGGSSLGVSKVFEAKELPDAVANSFSTGSSVIIEEFIEGKEYTCGVMGEKTGFRALHITEIALEKEFFDYAAKYTYDRTEEITPARLPEHLYKKCQQISEDIFEKFECRGVVRIDYILHGEEFYVIEINTVPGMTEYSLVPQQAAAMGISKTELITRIIENVL